jgi:hypothetical protein
MAAEQKIQHIATTSSKPFEKDTLSQAEELLRCLCDGYVLPDVGRGYWPTFCFSWNTHPPIQIEIFADRFEFYRMHDGRTDIREFFHKLGEPIASELLLELPVA